MRFNRLRLVIAIGLCLSVTPVSSCSDSTTEPGKPECPDSSDCDSTRVAACSDTSTTALPDRWTYRVVADYPHDPAAFTQGLVIREGRLFEGTGLRGRSTLREVELATGSVLRSVPLDAQFFGEGVTVLGDRVIQLTWQAHRGFVYARDTFEREEEFTYTGQGWGLTDDGERLILSDGTATLRFLDPETFEVLRTVDVYQNLPDGTRRPVIYLNELEWIDGEVFANVWQSNLVARICPGTGQVLGWIDFSGLLGRPECPSLDVLNGIAYDADAGRLYVTGKWWCRLFEVELVPGER